MNGTTAALRFFFTTTCDRPQMARFLRIVKQPQKLPVVLTPEEVLLLLEGARGPRDRTALAVAYGAGLRVSEVANLRVSDIDSTRMLLRIEQGVVSKTRLRHDGKKDRNGMLSCRRRAFRCVRDVVLSGWCKSSPKEVTTFVADGNCVAAMRGGEQPEANE